MRVAEGHGLFARLGRARHVVRPAQPVERPNHKSQNEHGAEDSDPREGVRAVAKDLGHGLPVSLFEHQKCIVSHQEKQLPSSRSPRSLSPEHHISTCDALMKRLFHLIESRARPTRLGGLCDADFHHKLLAH